LREEKVLENATVCFLYMENKILLGVKTRYIGEGRLNGPGGGIKDGEGPRECAVRELKKETGGVIVSLKDLEKIAILYVRNKKKNGEIFVCRVHIFLTRKWSKESRDTDEMINFSLFNIDSLPFDKMMPADKYWLPIALSGKKIIVRYSLSPFQKELLGEVKIEEVDSFPKE